MHHQAAQPRAARRGAPLYAGGAGDAGVPWSGARFAATGVQRRCRDGSVASPWECVLSGMALNKGKYLGTAGRFAFASLRFYERYQMCQEKNMTWNINDLCDTSGKPKDYGLLRCHEMSRGFGFSALCGKTDVSIQYLGKT